MGDERAETFRGLHGKGLLVLPNAWDAVTARLVERAGARAIATTSAAVSWSHGWPDGDRVPVRLVAATVTAIARVVRVPVSADVEGGYSSDPAAVGDAVGAVIDAGAVGINLEDGFGAPGLLCAKIAAAKEVGVRRGVDLFVNARTDVYLKDLAPADRRVEEALARAGQYLGAGADGIFVPGVTDPAEIRAITAGVPLPVNVLARPGLPPLETLAELGVRRLSAGSGLAASALGRVAALAERFLATGDAGPLAEGALPSREINVLMGG